MSQLLFKHRPRSVLPAFELRYFRRWNKRNQRNNVKDHGMEQYVPSSKFNNAGTGCIHGDAPVRMSDGTLKPIRQLKPLEHVETGDGGVAIIDTIIHIRTNGTVPMVLGTVTPKHPCINSCGDWCWPDRLAETRDTNCDLLVSVSFQQPNHHEPSIVVGEEGIRAIVLSHGIENDPVASHHFYGTRLWREGLPGASLNTSSIHVFGPNPVGRDPVTGRIQGWDMSKHMKTIAQ